MPNTETPLASIRRASGAVSPRRWPLIRSCSSLASKSHRRSSETCTPTVGVSFGVSLRSVIKVEPASEFYDYEAKYLRDDTRYLCPCGLNAEREGEIQQLAKQAFALIGGQGWGRVDFLMSEDGRPYLLEINTSPGMTDHSLVPMAARQAGIGFEQLVLQVLEMAHVG